MALGSFEINLQSSLGVLIWEYNTLASRTKNETSVLLGGWGGGLILIGDFGEAADCRRQMKGHAI